MRFGPGLKGNDDFFQQNINLRGKYKESGWRLNDRGRMHEVGGRIKEVGKQHLIINKIILQTSDLGSQTSDLLLQEHQYAKATIGILSRG
jgi:hypothetical protein